MTFLLRAVLVIGALSYLALMRGGADPAAEASRDVSKAVSGGLAKGASRLADALPSPQAVLPAALDAIPPETRDRAARAVLARGLMAELTRRAGLEEAVPRDAPASRDTLEDSDRQPAWRGVGGVVAGRASTRRRARPLDRSSRLRGRYIG